MLIQGCKQESMQFNITLFSVNGQGAFTRINLVGHFTGNLSVFKQTSYNSVLVKCVSCMKTRIIFGSVCFIWVFHLPLDGEKYIFGVAD